MSVRVVSPTLPTASAPTYVEVRRAKIAPMTRVYSYDAVGLTVPADDVWSQAPQGYRRYSATTRIGHGDRCWDEAAAAVLDWQIKIRSGFTVDSCTPDGRVREDAEYRLTAHLGPIAVHEPIRVVAVVDQPARCGFSYGTLQGHPVSGEEAFIVHRTANGDIWLTLRSLTHDRRLRPMPARSTPRV